MDSLSNINIPFDEKTGLIVKSKGVEYEFIINIKRNSNKAIVLGSGSLPRVMKPKFKGKPVFNRITWPFQESTIYYNDPTRKLDENLTGGWGLGTPNNWYLEEISKIIKILTKNIFNYKNPKDSFKNLIFYGSSMGGFMSLQLSTLIKNSVSVIEIPQFDLCEWVYWPILKKTLFDDKNTEEIKKKYSYRLNVFDLMIREKYIPNTYMVLDCSVERDFQIQYKDFLMKLDQLPYKENDNINKIRIRIDGKNIGHEQLNYVELYKLLEKVCLLMDYEYEGQDSIISKYFGYGRIALKQQTLLLKYQIGRLDLKNFGDKNSIEIIKTSDKHMKIATPKWFNTNEGEGKIIESYTGDLKLEIKCKNDGIFKITLRGKYLLDGNSKIIPIYINFNYLTVNEKEIINGKTVVWHNKPFTYEKNVKNGEIIKIHAKWLPY